MRSKLWLVVVVFVILCVWGCKPNPTPTPSPTMPVDIINIPDWVNSPEAIATWNRQLNTKWTSDPTTTGYANYYFTPIEFTLSKIPDVNKPGSFIEKTPYQGDCDDFVKWNGYLPYVVMHSNPWIIHFLINGNIHVAHAIVYGIADGKYHFFDNHAYRGAWDTKEAFMEAKYPGYVIYFHEPLKTVLERLWNEGHLKYAPIEERKSSSNKKSCEDGVCPID